MGLAGAMARDQRGSRSRDWSQRQFRFAGRGRAVTMGLIGKYIYRAALALIPVSLAGALRMARAPGGVDSVTGRSNARVPRLLRRPVTA